MSPSAGQRDPRCFASLVVDVGLPKWISSSSSFLPSLPPPPVMSSKESAAGKLDIYTTASMRAILWEMGSLELTLIL